MRLDFIAIWLEAFSNTFKGRTGQMPHVDHCLNCDNPVDEDVSYCAQCGQKLRYSYVTIGSLLNEFFANIFNLDNTVFRSLKKLFIPGYLAQEYMEGRRKKYLNPVRFFFVALVILFSVASFTTEFDMFDSFTEGDHKRIATSEFKKQYTDWRDSVDFSNQEQIVLDSFESALLNHVADPETDTMSQNLTLIGVNMRNYKFLRKDAYEMNIDTLLDNYEIEKFWERLVVSQYIRSLRNPSGMLQFFVGNLLWGVISTIFILGLALKLLYIRRNKYYVEHVILLFNIHTFGFLVLSVLSIIKNYFGEAIAEIPEAIGAIAILVYSFLSIKRYYGQGIFKSLIKYLISGLLYFIIMLVMVSIVFVISLLLYK